MFQEEEWVPISALAQYAFCPRRVVFIHTENLWADNQWTMEGKILHETADTQTQKTARGTRIVRSLRISDAENGIYGVADVVEFKRTDGMEFAQNRAEFLSDGVHLPLRDGLWFPIPVEFKRGKTRTDKTYEIQLCAQGLCLEKKFAVTIPFGFLYYGESGRRKRIDFTVSLRQNTCTLVEKVRQVLFSDTVPRPKYSKKCRQCSLVDLCLPQMGTSGSVERYIRNALASRETGNHLP